MDSLRARRWRALRLIHRQWSLDMSSLNVELYERIENRDRSVVVACLNPHSYITCIDDPMALDALESSDFILADGAGMSFAGLALNLPVTRIPGPDFHLSLMGYLNVHRPGSRVFYLGSTPGVLEKIRSAVRQNYPALMVCGVFSPPFVRENLWSEGDLYDMGAAVREANPDVLLVGMTAPKQEIWAYNCRSSLGVPVIACIGAAFDFFAGSKHRAGPSVRAIGLEWLQRLLREPRRMARRNFISTPRFLWEILRVAARKYSMFRKE